MNEQTEHLFRENDVGQMSDLGDPFEQPLADRLPETIETVRAKLHAAQDRQFAHEEERQNALFTAYQWPPALMKACVDEFEYTAWIDGVGAVEFTSANVLPGGWVHLNNPKPCDVTGSDPRIANRWQRGLDVRVSAIRWVADGGH